MSTAPQLGGSGLDSAQDREPTSAGSMLPLVEPLSPFEASFHRDTPVTEWDADDILEWLTSLNCEEYSSKFRENDIDGEVILHLGKRELRQLVDKVGDRIKITRSIKKLQADIAKIKDASGDDAESHGPRTDPLSGFMTGSNVPPRADYFGSIDAFNSDRYDNKSLRFQFTDGKTRFVSVADCVTAADVKLNALRKVFPSITRSAVNNWDVCKDEHALSDAALLSLIRDPNSHINLRLVPATDAIPGRQSSRQRPTSQHVSAHLTEYFPGVDSGELEQTVRNSVLVSRRLSSFTSDLFNRRISNLVVPETILERPPSPNRVSRRLSEANTFRKSALSRRFSVLSFLQKQDLADAIEVGSPGPGSGSSGTEFLNSPDTPAPSMDDSQFLVKLENEETSPTKWIRGQVIGSGSFGTVYMGMNAFNGELLAVKQVDITERAGIDEQRKNKMVEALRREVVLMKDFNHENIVQYRGFKSEDNTVNIFLEYVPGGSLASMLNQYGSFEENLVRHYVRQILAGLIYLHERNIIHRDIKGANILVNDKGQIKISDFGLSKKIETQQLLSTRHSMQGSVFWMAPEVVKQVVTTDKADIWSLGCLIIELMTGTHPFPQLTQMQAIFKLGNSVKPSIPTNCSKNLQEFLEQSLEVDYRSRPTAAQLFTHPFITDVAA